MGGVVSTYDRHAADSAPKPFKEEDVVGMLPGPDTEMWRVRWADIAFELEIGLFRLSWHRSSPAWGSGGEALPVSTNASMAPKQVWCTVHTAPCISAKIAWVLTPFISFCLQGREEAW